jgi:DNA-binding transcriptional MerR regulator
VQPEYVPTGEAARRLGFHVRTLQRWVRTAQIEPHHLTAGGHARWDVDRLRRELIEVGLRRRER